jgi:plastocyanin
VISTDPEQRPTAARRRAHAVLAALAALALLAAACGGSGSSDDSTSAGDDTSSGEPNTSESSEAVSTDPTAPPEMPEGPPPAEIPADDPMNATEPRAGAERIRYQFGPVIVKPGQNSIDFSGFQGPKPEVDGWITRISPNLQRADGSVPPVDVIHLHHGVWVNLNRTDPTFPQLPERFFAAGEEKTIFEIPEGYAYRYDAEDRWLINYMLHNLFPTEEKMWITYDIDFIPADAPEAEGMVEARPIWMDVQNGSIYPVFDVHKGDGDGELAVYPDDYDAPYGDGADLSRWTVDRDGVLLGGGVHLHPGGLYGDLTLQRAGASAPPGSDAAADVDGDTATLFRSEAKYWEPAGAVSWDVAMTVAPADWRIEVKAGDVLGLSVAYDSERASWYESMGIFVVWMADAAAPGDVAPADPFVTKVNRKGEITHDHLPENDHHGGEKTDLPDATELPDGEAVTSMKIIDWVYEFGDTSEGADSVPTVAQGDTITFDNIDAPLDNGIWHTVTACKAPCNKSTGIAYPLADAEIEFDSGQLGDDGVPTAGRTTWSTPDDLPPGTYTYFCRVHPFMRGAFRVVED